MTITDKPHQHDTIGDSGDCPACRAWNVDFAADAPHAFGLTFFADHHHDGECHCGDPSVTYGEVIGLAFVRTWSPVGDDAADMAWATGCNPGGAVAIAELPLTAVVATGVPLFRLITDEGEQAQALATLYRFMEEES